MVQRTVAGATREYLVLDYAPSQARPARATGSSSRWTSCTWSPATSAARAPTLDRLGGADWAKRKSRARKAVRADRRRTDQAVRRAAGVPRATRSAPDTVWQRELEDAFAYVETPDQLAAISEVKRDMEQVVPMDRLICGDVGYGKTEIAVRAAFKAVMDGKQVAVLVPTTLLVQQHHATFADRYAGLPGDGRGAEPVPDRRREEEGGRGARRRRGRRRRRHPPAAVRRGARSRTSAW